MKRREWRSAWGGRERESEREKEREREREIERVHAGERVQEKVLWLLLLYVFSSTWACPMQIGLSQECCFFCLKSSLWSLDLPCLLATAILDSFSLFYLPNTMNCVFSWQNSVSFCPASFYIPRPNLPVTPGIS